MELGPIFRALFHNRARFVLISLEVALTLAISVNCVNLILDMRRTMSQPSGMDEENILTLTVRPFGQAFNDEDYLRSVREDDLRRIRAAAGVRAATLVQQLPLSGSGSATGRKAMGAESDTLTAPYFLVSRQALETFGVVLIAGRDFVEDDFHAEEEKHNVILTRKLAERLFPDGDAVGKQIVGGSGVAVNTVIGIVDHMLNSWPSSTVAESVMILPDPPERREYYHIVVRAEPGAVEDLYTGLEEALLASNGERVVEVRTLGEVRADNFRSTRVIVQLLAGVMVLLVLVTALGIVGLTSFSVTRRRRHIGVRRALGATRSAILRYFLTENWVITSLGIVAGVGLSFLLNYALMRFASGVKLDWQLVGLGALALWVVGLMAALTPALRGTYVAPVVATRSV